MSADADRQKFRWVQVAHFAIGLFAIAFVSSCGDTQSGEAKTVKAEHVEPRCDVENCSDFPKGYYSLRVHEAWFYIPNPKTIRTKTGIEGNWRTEIAAKNGFVFHESNEPWRSPGTERAQQMGLVVSDAHNFDFFHCCEGIAAFYDRPGMIDVSQVRFSAAGTGIKDPLEKLRFGGYSSLPAEVPEAFKGIAERYYLRILEGAEQPPYRMNFIAISKSPLMLGSYVVVACLGTLCSISWAGDADTGIPRGRLVHVKTGGGCDQDKSCLTRSALDARFEQYERLLADFEAILTTMKTRPTEDEL